MKKKEYLKPAMGVELIQQDEELLAGSGFSAGRTNYGTANDGVDVSELDESELDDETGEWIWN